MFFDFHRDPANERLENIGTLRQSIDSLIGGLVRVNSWLRRRRTLRAAETLICWLFGKFL